MKKFMLVIIAAVMAVGFSAFTSGPTATDPVYYQHNGGWVLYQGAVCPEGDIPECIKSTAHGNKQLFFNQDPMDPVTRNLP